jgi:hypothetical protein
MVCQHIRRNNAHLFQHVVTPPKENYVLFSDILFRLLRAEIKTALVTDI